MFYEKSEFNLEGEKRRESRGVDVWILPWMGEGRLASMCGWISDFSNQFLTSASSGCPRCAFTGYPRKIGNTRPMGVRTRLFA